MKYFLNFFIICLFLLGCGKKNNSTPENNTQDSIAQKPNIQEKEYLNKRPEEFKEFVMLSDQVPFTGKVATKDDVTNKLAVFHLDSKGDNSHRPLQIKLPFYAFLNKDGKTTFVAIIQAETLKGDTILGYKNGTGMFGICNPKELEIFNSQKGQVYKTLSN